MDKRITYVFWGEEKKEHNWIGWYNDVKYLIEFSGYQLSHIGVKLESYDSKKIVSAKRKEKDILLRMSKGEIPNSLECFSLPYDYKMAVFDYNIYCVRNKQYISYTFYDNDMNESKEKIIRHITEKYFVPDSGEVFQTSLKEVPLLYVATKKSKNIKSYEFIKSLY